MAENGQQLVSVPPGFRFHPTDEELLYYYLRKKVSYEPIEVDVIREVDLNKLEPWDLKEKCRIGSGHQNEWYFFSHKDKKYPTGTRTNRATSAGFWKATGRDKAIHMAPNHSKRIGMRKTLVFYTGRAPHGQKTDWIMHEYRLIQDDNPDQVQEDGWVVCRVFKKKIQKAEVSQEQLDHNYKLAAMGGGAGILDDAGEPKNNNNNNNHIMQDQQQQAYNNNNNNDYSCSFDGCMQLPQLFSPESSQQLATSSSTTPHAAAAAATCPDQNMYWRPLSCGGLVQQQQQERFNTTTDQWSFLNRLLASSTSDNNYHQQYYSRTKSDQFLSTMGNPNSIKFPFPFPYPYPHLPSPPDFIKFSK